MFTSPGGFDPVRHLEQGPDAHLVDLAHRPGLLGKIVGTFDT